MKIYISTSGKKYIRMAYEAQLDAGLNENEIAVLVSKFYMTDETMDWTEQLCLSRGIKPKLMIDSGAFTAMTRGVKFSLDDYIRFLEKHQRMIEFAVNLDVHNYPEKGLANQEWLEARSPVYIMPVYHAGEKKEYLLHYLDHYPYVGLGGTAGSSLRKASILRFVRDSFAARPNTFNRLHGFGMVFWDIISMFPWKSVDGSDWCNFGRFGRGRYWDEVQHKVVGVSRDAATYNSREMLYSMLGKRAVGEGFFQPNPKRGIEVKTYSGIYIAIYSYARASAWLSKRWGT